MLTPDKVALKKHNVRKVRVRLVDETWISIYPNHAPMVAETLPGPIEWKTETESGEVSLSRGILRVQDDRVLLLAPGAGDESQGELAGAEPRQRFERLARRLMDSLEEAPASGNARETEVQPK